MSDFRHQAIANLYPKVTHITNKYGPLDVNEESVSIDESKVGEEVKKLETEWKVKQYQRDRQPEYPQIGDQLDMLYHAIDAGKVDKTSDFYKALKAVKDKHPKG